MQPAPTEASQNATSVENPNNPFSSSNHGLPHASHLASGVSPLTVDDARVSSPDHAPPDDGDTASISSGATSRGRRAHTGRRLSNDTTRTESSGSPGSRIDEYERAYAKPRKPSDGMIFQVIQSKDKSSQVAIQDFPNEVLTHILSHLPPETLSSMSLVSRRFHRLVTTPPAWRIAFARYFPGSELAATAAAIKNPGASLEKSQRRVFTRLSALASWRSEYILRTRLLRSLSRGRPALQGVTKQNSSRNSNASSAAVITYQSGLMFPVSHIHATFGIGLNKKQPLFVHGASEQGLMSSSDPTSGKVGNWGLSDFPAFKHFSDLFIGEPEHGLGPGQVVGMSNVMDVSQLYGRIYGEACPGGGVFYTPMTDQRGHFLTISSAPVHDLGIPEVSMIGCSVTSAWIAKSEAIPKISNGVFGMLAGFSNGVLCAYGTTSVHDRRQEKGEPTAKWVLCPGVPIISIVVDGNVNRRRLDRGRIWAVVLNALGEVFCLTSVPTIPELKGKAPPAEIDRLAWQTGRTVEWTLTEATRRQAKADPFGDIPVDGSYSPHTSSEMAGLSTAQLVAEAKEVEKFLLHKPKHFQTICDGWDMRRKLLVDFAGDDRHGAGEAVFVLNCGLGEGDTASIQRLVRCRKKISVDYDLEAWPPVDRAHPHQSVFGSASVQRSGSPSPSSTPRSRTSSTDDVSGRYDVEWSTSNYAFGDLSGLQLTSFATDDSELALLAPMEDPLLGMSAGSNTSSPIGSPLNQAHTLSSPADIPGQRARLMAVGTKIGIVLVWDMRASLPSAVDVVNTVQPIRSIYTRSPEISSLGLTSLYLVHGGNDGLVQAWDPLASTSEPIRTLNSRFSDRARRRIAQAYATAQGVGHNYFAAGAILLDPDPTALRGMVSLGTHLRYWSYSSTAADAYKSRKRGQLRKRSERGSNAADQKVTATGRGALKDYIVNEQVELEREKRDKRKEQERLTGRFGMNLLGEGASEEEMLAYATMLSEESWASDEVRRSVDASGVGTPSKMVETEHENDESVDREMEEAIRLSLQESEQTPSSPLASVHEIDNIPIRYAKSSKRKIDSPAKAGGSKQPQLQSTGDEDLEFALQLSLAEDRSRRLILDEAEYPSLEKSSSSEGSQSGGKGKGKAKRRSGKNRT